MRQIEFSRSQVAQTQEQKIQQVVGLWNERMAWWQTKFQEYLPSKPAAGRQGSGSGQDAGPLASGALIEIDPAAATDTSNTDRLDYNTGLISSDTGSSVISIDPDSGDGDGNEAGGGVPRRFDVPQQVVGKDQGDHPVIGAVPGNASPQGAARGPGWDIAVTIKPWDPNTPYITAMMGVAPKRAYDVYLAQRQNYAHSPGFYFDFADYLCSINQKALGIRVLTDIAALESATPGCSAWPPIGSIRSGSANWRSICSKRC